MKYNTIIKLLLIALALQLSGCKKENIKEIKKETANASTASDTIFDAKNPYYLFIQKNNPEALKDNKLIYFKEEDIDLDGKKEAIVALGVIDKNLDIQATVNQIFLLRNDNGAIKELDNDYDDLLIIRDVEIISLEGIKQKFICLYVIKGGSSYGFVLFELKGNKINEFFSVAPLGQGSCYLVDKNNDGKYDGYVKSFMFSNTVNYEVEESYVFEDNKFKPSETHVKISDYPTNIENLIFQYISLRSLYIPESLEVKQRLKQICTDQTAPAIKWNKEAWEEACSKYLDEFDKSIEIKINEEDKTAMVSYTDEEQKQYQLRFEVEMSNKRWQITKVTITKDGEK